MKSKGRIIVLVLVLIFLLCLLLFPNGFFYKIGLNFVSDISLTARAIDTPMDLLKGVFSYLQGDSASHSTSSGLLGDLDYVPGNENVICIYNANSNLSTQICNYYLEKRPGASILGLDIPDNASVYSNKQDISMNNFETYVNLPLKNWITNHPEKFITHLAVAKDVPYKVEHRSAAGYLATNGKKISNSYLGQMNHFDPREHRDIKFAVSFLQGYNFEDIKIMIDKAQLPASSVADQKWVLDADRDSILVYFDSGVNLICGENYVLNGVNYRNVPWDMEGRDLACGSIVSSGAFIGANAFFVKNSIAESFKDSSLKYENLPKNGVFQRVNFDPNKKDFIIDILPETKREFYFANAIYTDGVTDFSLIKELNLSKFELSQLDDGGLFLRLAIRSSNLNSPLGASGVLVKKSGSGPESITYSSFVEINNSIPFSTLFLKSWSIEQVHINKFRKYLLNFGVADKNIVLENTNFNYSLNGGVIYYFGSGSYHNGYPWLSASGCNYGNGCWITTPNLFNFNVSNRAIFTSLESWNAENFYGNSNHTGMTGASPGQGKIIDSFSSNAFGGVNYSRSFSGALGFVDEPGLNYLTLNWASAYANGLTLGEVYLNSNPNLYEIGYAPVIGGVWYPGFTGIIAVGDPLMKIYDSSYLNNSKKLLGEQCSEDGECLSGKCSADINGKKFCYNPSDGGCLVSICNSSDITKYTYSSECQSKTYLLDDFISVDNGYSKCTSLSKIATCVDSNWVLSTCNNGQKCQPGFLYNSCDSKIACNDFCGNQRIIGETCANSSQCADYGISSKIPTHCGSDIFGVSRCHFDKNACIVNETGETIASDHYYCLNSSTRILCSLGNWSLTSNCEFGCSNGFCNFNNAEEFVFDSLEPGQYALYVIPLIPEKNKVSSLFGTFIEFGDTLIIWNVGDFGSVELGKIRGSSLFTLNMPEFWWADKIVSGRLGSTLSSTVSNKSLEIGEAFSIYFSENKKTPNLLKITGIKSPYKQTLTISGSRMMTILDCSEEYNSSRVLREINSIGGNCTKLGKLLLNGSYSYFDLNVIVQEDFSLKKGYGYVLICDAMQPINWTPSCSAYSGCEIGANCGQNGFYGPSFCRGNQLIKNYINFTCNTFGRSYGSCSNSSSELVLETCNYGCNSSMGECNPFVRCSNNLDCGRDYSGQIFCQNSFRSLNQTSFVCNNPGTALSYCSNSTSKVDLEYCPTGCNLNKECNLPINCSSNFDCPGAVLVDDPFCWEGSLDSYQLVSECVNPGLPGSFCSSRKQQITIKKCEPNYFGEWSNSFCYDNSIFRNRETIIRECSSEILDCLHESRVETEIIETCFYGCSSSSCSFPFQCFSDSDCVSENKCSIGSCVNAGTIESSCSYSPLSDGSSCGENQKCFSGNCKKVGRIINDSLLNFTIFIDSRIDPENDFYGSKKIEFNFSQSKIVEFFHNFSKNDLDLRLINIKKGISSVNRTFAIINSLNISSKTLYLNRAQNNSNAVCIADRENLNNETDILLNCSILPCPGSFGNYNCSIENNFFIISGLKHSGVLEYLLYCGDNICNNGETCASCSKDCGACSNGGSGDSGAGSSGGGGGGSSGSSSVGSSGNNSSGNSNKCLTNWNCSEWQNCIGGRQIRTCAKEKLDCEVSSPAIIERTCDTENNQTINLMPFKKFSVNNSYWYIIGIIVFVGIIILISWIIISISRKIAILKESSRE